MNIALLLLTITAIPEAPDRIFIFHEEQFMTVRACESRMADLELQDPSPPNQYMLCVDTEHFLKQASNLLPR